MSEAVTWEELCKANLFDVNDVADYSEISSQVIKVTFKKRPKSTLPYMHSAYPNVKIYSKSKNGYWSVETFESFIEQIERRCVNHV